MANGGFTAGGLGIPTREQMEERGYEPTGRKRVGMYGEQLVRNLPGSAQQLIKDLSHPFIHPVETVKGLLSLVGEDPSARQAVGDYLGERYGGVSNIARTFRDDPVGIVSDILGLASGGGGLLGKMGGRVGSISSRVGRVSNTLDPASLAMRGTGELLKRGGQLSTAGARNVLGVTTGTGSGTVGRAIQTGLEGGTSGESFRQGLRGRSLPSDLYGRLNEQLDAIGARRRNQYRAAEGSLANTQIDTDVIQGFIDDLRPPKTTSGQARGPVHARLDQAEKLLQEFIEKDDTLLGDVDILKKDIDELITRTAGELDPAEAVTSSLVRQIGDHLGEVDPIYAEMMADYHQLKTYEREMRNAFSAGRNQTEMQAIRRMMQATRQNVNTDMGGLGDMLDELAPGLMDELSGRAMNPATPVGMQRVTSGLVGGAGITGLTTNPVGTMGYLASSSPRLVGEVAHGAGRVASGIAPPARAAADFARGMRVSGITPAMRSEAWEPEGQGTGARLQDFTQPTSGVELLPSTEEEDEEYLRSIGVLPAR